jgi:biopolymer transport protein ExbD
MISLNADGHVYLSVGDSQRDKDKKQAMLESINQRFSLGLTPTDIANLKKAPFIGVPIAQLKQQAALSTDQMNSKTLPGIPSQDTARNEMNDWMAAAVQAYQGEKMNLILKGDNVAKYPVFKNIIAAFKKNEQFKFSMVTNPQAVPQGSDLWKESVTGKSQ